MQSPTAGVKFTPLKLFSIYTVALSEPSVLVVQRPTPNTGKESLQERESPYFSLNIKNAVTFKNTFSTASKFL